MSCSQTDKIHETRTRVNTFLRWSFEKASWLCVLPVVCQQWVMRLLRPPDVSNFIEQLIHTTITVANNLISSFTSSAKNELKLLKKKIQILTCNSQILLLFQVSRDNYSSPIAIIYLYNKFQPTWLHSTSTQTIGYISRLI